MNKIVLLLLIVTLAFTTSFAQEPNTTSPPTKIVKPANKHNASYALGVTLANTFQKDSLDIQYDRFYKGMEDILNKKQTEVSDAKVQTILREFSAKQTSNMSEVSYAIGLTVAKKFITQGLEDIDFGVFKEACNHVITNSTLEIPSEDANQIIGAYQKEKMDAKGKILSAEGKAFLAANAKKEGVITTASGLQYKVILKGTGLNPTAKDKVTVHYTGTLIDGTKFDSSVDRGKPSTFGLYQVIKGWTEGVQLMKEGAKYRFYIPYNLAYGERGNANIPGYSTLIFDIDLIKVIKEETQKPKQ